MRKRNAMLLERRLSSFKAINIIEKEAGVTRVHYIRYPILVKSGKRDMLVIALCKKGIEASSVYPEIKEKVNEFPGAATLSKELLTLPCHPGVTESDIDTIVDTIRKIM